ncbi:MAG TPA: hypothetical protein VF474_15055 [Phenylobacterium sp.]
MSDPALSAALAIAALIIALAAAFNGVSKRQARAVLTAFAMTLIGSAGLGLLLLSARP